MRTAFERRKGTLPRLILGSLLISLVLVVGWPGLSAPPGAYRPPQSAIGNPKPYYSAKFGFSLAGVGNDRILIGVPWDNVYQGAGGGVGGTSYLFDTNGSRITTFSNPPQKLGDFFGHAVAALGAGRVIVSARLASVSATNAGAVYLFNTNGTLLTIFTNMPVNLNDHFGDAVAGVGTDRVLIGAATGGTNNGGAAYLFATNGTLLTSFHNPEPTFFDYFGSAVVGLGDNLVAIGAYGEGTSSRSSGVVYLFNASGLLLTTVTNPAPVAGGAFGCSVAALNGDRLLVGARGNSISGLYSGAGFLFDKSGKMLTALTNPAPANGDGFGQSVAAVGGDRILIGAYLDDTGLGKSGASYMFDTNGTLLATFVNPTPEPGDRYGYAVGALGQDLFLVGADSDNSGAEGAGSVYVYGVPRQPALGISANATNVSLRWAGPEPSFILQQSGWLDPTSGWSDVEESPQVNGPTNLVTQPLTTTNRFYRLRWP